MISFCVNAKQINKWKANFLEHACTTHGCDLVNTCMVRMVAGQKKGRTTTDAEY